MKSPSDLVLDTFNLVIELLPPQLGANLKLHPKDPQPLKKGLTDICRGRVLPVAKCPLKFWSSSWCFYEIGVGRYEPAPGEGLNVGGISFIMFPDQQATGRGKYRQPVTSLLKQLHMQRPDWSLVGPSLPFLAFGVRYSARQHKFFSPETAAQDLAWLIQHSLPAIEAIKI